MKLAPGDAVRDVLNVEDVALNQDVIDAQREEMGLNRPLLTQYGEWLSGAIKLDFGQSLMTRRPVTEEIITRVPATLLLTGTSVLVMLSISIPIGILSSFKSLCAINQFGRIFAVIGTSIPGFWLGILLIELFSVRLGWLPQWEPARSAT